VKLFKQGWWSELNFNGSGFCSGARFSKLCSSNSGSEAGHFPFTVPTPAPFDLDLPAPALLQLRSEKKFAVSHMINYHLFILTVFISICS